MTLENRRFSAIFFDYGGTLDAPGVAWRNRFFPIYLQAGVEVSPEKFARAFYTSDDSLVAEAPVHMNLTQVVFEQVKRVLENLGIFTKQLQTKIAEKFLEDSFSNINEIKPALQTLRKNFKMGIISNNYGNLENICKETGLDTLMDVLVDSNRIGHTKPSPEIFRAGLSALDVEPFSSIMVGDSLPRDIKGARDLGMEAFWLSPIKDKTKSQHEIDNLTVISSIKNIPAILNH
ncbi:MAG: hypothetical protein DSZ23_01430 [Thermodesulfatator sp.]|nr:MAG: hypothetical protein DSZ23_01430 [Thermodesulfatator sp.]